jgi:antitoxin component YwqK of YwqJK toxin-antitoxin module
MFNFIKSFINSRKSQYGDYTTSADGKEWLNKNFYQTGKEHAVYYRIKADGGDFKNGVEIVYYLNGVEKRQITYVNGKEEGEYVEFHSNGQLATQGKYTEGKLTGLFRHWYPDGSLQQRGYFTPDNDAPFGVGSSEYVIESFWDVHGNQLVKKGTGDWFRIDEAGKIIEKGKYRDGKKEGEWEDYYESGELYDKDFYVAGKIIWGERYQKNGEKSLYDGEIDRLPEFPGGQQLFFAYISKNIRYPDYARRKNIKGVVHTAFVIDYNGFIKNIVIQQGIGGGCDEESIRVLSEMPRWKPGIQAGRKVSVRYAMPIKFSLYT